MGSNQALGRSRGGLTTKIHAACLDENHSATVFLSAGNIADCSAFEPLYEELDCENVLEAAALDKGYDADAIREHLLKDGIEPVIPPKSNRKTPLTYNRDICRERNRVERFFNKLKQFRRIATRYEKRFIREVPALNAGESAFRFRLRRLVRLGYSKQFRALSRSSS